MVEYGVLILFSLALLGCVTFGLSVLYALLLGGAILSGVRVGDRCSPMSSSACLVCEVTRTDLYGNIKNMLRTGAVPLLACCGIYALLDQTQHPHAASLSQVGAFRDYFTLTAVVILPAVLLFALALARVNVRLAMLASICAGLWIACFRQGFSAPELLNIMAFGFHPDDPELAACYPWLLPLWHFYSQRGVKNAEKCETVDRKGDV